MNEFEQYITDIGLVEFAEWHFKKDECDEYLHEPTNIAHKIWVDKDRAIDELQKINSTNQNTLQHFEHEYKKVVVERDALQKRIDDIEFRNKILLESERNIASGCDSWRDSHRLLDQKIESACKSIDSFFDNQVGTPTQREYCNFIAEIKQDLRGEHE